MEKKATVTLFPTADEVRMWHKEEKEQQMLLAKKAKLTPEQIIKYERASWFRHMYIALGHTIASLSDNIIKALVLLYIHRNDEEINELKVESNPKNELIQELESVREKELNEFKSDNGLLVPCLEEDNDVYILTSIWNGLPETMGVVQTCGYNDKGAPNIENEWRSIHNISQLALKNKISILKKCREKAKESNPLKEKDSGKQHSKKKLNVKNISAKKKNKKRNEQATEQRAKTTTPCNNTEKKNERVIMRQNRITRKKINEEHLTKEQQRVIK